MLTDIPRDEPHVPQHVFIVLLSTLLLGMAFPLAPFWGFGMRLAGLLMVWHFRGQFCSVSRRVGSVYLTSMLCLSAIVSLQIVNELTADLSWVLDRVTFIHGLQLTTSASLFVSLLDAGLIGGVAWITWRFYRRQGAVELWRRLAIVLAVLFAGWGLLATITTYWTATPVAFMKNLNWLRIWIEWSLCFLLAACIVLEQQKTLFLKSVVAVGALNAAIVIGQHLVGDFSYVLESAQSFDVYFTRSRGNHYYHAAAMQLLLLPLFAAFVLNSSGRRNWWIWAAGLLIAVALYINGTRATALAATVGAGFFLLVYIPWWRARLRPIAFALAGLLAFGTMITYTKPTLKGLAKPTIVHVAQESVQVAQESKLAESNSGRIGLMNSGLDHVESSPLFGQGAGNISISVQRSMGDTTTYSSHCLYVDSFLAGGWAAGVCLLLLFGVPSLFLIGDRLFGPNSSVPDQATAATIGLFAAFGASCFFFSIERADTLALFAAMLGIVFPRARPADVPETQAEPAPLPLQGERRLVYAGVGLAAIALPFVLPLSSLPGIVLGTGVALAAPFLLIKSEELLVWISPRRSLQMIMLLLALGAPACAILTSSCYFWPAIEFAWRHHKDSIPKGDKEKEVYTNSSALARTTGWIAALIGDSDLKIQVLQDDPSQLPHNATILWNPVNDRYYPNLINHFGYHITPPSVRAPGFRLPRNWNVIHSKQMTVSFLNVGPSVSPAIRLEDIGHVTVNGKQVVFRPHGQPPLESNRLRYRFTPTHALRLKGGRLSCQFEAEKAAGIGRSEQFELDGAVVLCDGQRLPLNAEGVIQGGLQQLSFQLPKGEIQSLEMTLVGGQSTRFRALSPAIQCEVLPDVAAHAIDIRSKDGRDARTLVDDNLATVHGYWTDAPASLTFDFSEHATAISLYRISRAKTIDAGEVERLSWQLLGSDDAETWHVLDSRNNVPIGDEYKNFHSFTVANPRKYRLYRLLFPADSGKPSTAICLSEIELLPLSDDQPGQSTSRKKQLAESKTERDVR